MFILGVSCYYRDSAAVLLQDGQLIAAAEEERFSRVKHDNGYPKHAIEFCLRQGGITPKDLDYGVFYEKPLVKFERILMISASGGPPRPSLSSISRAVQTVRTIFPICSLDSMRAWASAAFANGKVLKINGLIFFASNSGQTRSRSAAYSSLTE